MAAPAQPADDNAAPPVQPDGEKSSGRRQIPGGLPYTTTPGVLKKVLQRIPTSEKPTIFTTDFLGTVMEVTGGSARPIPPILKAVGMLNSSGAPTDLYAQFQTEAGRPVAALQALRNGFAEIFRRNQYAHKADDSAITDIVVQITGLPRKEQIVRSIVNTFQAFQELARNAKEDAQSAATSPSTAAAAAAAADLGANKTPDAASFTGGSPKLQLAYNINVVLPETTNVEVYNAIFRSLRGNLLT